MSKHPNTEEGTVVWPSFPSAAISLMLLLQRSPFLSPSPSYSDIPRSHCPSPSLSRRRRSGRGSLEEFGNRSKDSSPLEWLSIQAPLASELSGRHLCRDVRPTHCNPTEQASTDCHCEFRELRPDATRPRRRLDDASIITGGTEFYCVVVLAC